MQAEPCAWFPGKVERHSAVLRVRVGGDEGRCECGVGFRGAVQWKQRGGGGLGRALAVQGSRVWLVSRGSTTMSCWRVCRWQGRHDLLSKKQVSFGVDWNLCVSL